MLLLPILEVLFSCCYAVSADLAVMPSVLIMARVVLGVGGLFCYPRFRFCARAATAEGVHSLSRHSNCLLLRSKVLVQLVLFACFP